MIDEYGATVERRLAGESSRNLEKKINPVPIRPLQLIHDITEDSTQGSAVRGKNLTV
jgi:hypothetical protein